MRRRMARTNAVVAKRPDKSVVTSHIKNIISERMSMPSIDRNWFSGDRAWETTARIPGVGEFGVNGSVPAMCRWDRRVPGWRRVKDGRGTGPRPAPGERGTTHRARGRICHGIWLSYGFE